MLNNYKLDREVANNFSKVRLRLFLFPVLLLFVIVFVIFKESTFTIDGYISIQKDLFFYLNGKLSEFPSLQFNLTQLGDALIFLSLLTIFIVYAPKLWGAILTSSLISLVVSFLLKKIFSVPRPAAMFDTDSFFIIGETLKGNTSLPSGHSITTFTLLTTLLFAFVPKKLNTKIIWFLIGIMLGIFIAFSRVGVGAHYPLDVIIGSIVGYLCALLGIVINNKVNWWNWIQNKKYYPIFILILSILIYLVINKILANNLLIFYFSLLVLITTFYLMIKTYVKK